MIRIRPPTEAEVLKTCLATLGALGVFAWRAHTGAVAASHRGHSR